MKIRNTLGGTKEEFTPLIAGKVGMYNCGPTVYDYAHIGNLRSFILADLLRRAFEWNGFEVNQVMNITDIGLLTHNDAGEDKMVLALKREKKPLTLEAMKELGNFYTERFLENLQELNVETPKHIVKASEHIAEQISLIQKLEEKGFTYKTSDGVYFDTSKFPTYGKLGNIDIEGLKEGARIQASNEKKNITDFALWKFSATGGSAFGGNDFGFESSFGKGFPGWHIECSAMSMKYLGESFDVHTGGIDLIPTHHNNEIAQSESVTGKPFVHYWLHNAFVNVESGKMSKSEGNFITLNTLKEKGIHPLAYRYWLLTANYSTPVNFTWESVLGAQKAFEGILGAMPDEETGEISPSYLKEFEKHVNNDLDTPQLISLLHKLIGDKNIGDDDKSVTIEEFDRVLGLNIARLSRKIKDVPEDILSLAEKRTALRAENKWQEADEIRKEIESKGFLLRDETGGTVITRKLTPQM